MTAIRFEMSDESIDVTCEGNDFVVEAHGHIGVLEARSSAAMHAITTGHTVREVETHRKVIHPCG